MALTDNLIGQWNLDEQSGDVARNQVRTLMLSEDFSAIDSTDAYGDIPPGAIRYTLGLEGGGDETIVCSIDGGVLSMSMDAGATASDYFGFQWPGLISDGDEIVVEIRYRTLSRTAPAQLAFNAGGTSYKVISGGVTDWQTKSIRATTVGTNGLFLMLANSSSGPGEISVEIDYLKVTIENAGTYARDASLTHTAVADLGLIDGGQDFNGSSDSVTLPAELDSVPSISSPFSVSFWVKPSADVSTEQILFGSARTSTDRFVIGIKSGELLTSFWDGAFQHRQGGAVIAEEWAHVVVTYDGTGGCSLYIDGALQNASSNPIFLASGVRSTLGCSNNYSYHYGGSLTRLYVFSRVLASHEIAELVAQGPLELNEVAHIVEYNFNETSGNILRNNVTEELVDIDFSINKSGPFGAPDGMSLFTSGGFPTFSSSVSSNTWNLSLSKFIAGDDYFGASDATPTTIGESQLLEIEYNVTSVNGTGYLSLFDGLNRTDITGAVTSGYVTSYVPYICNGNPTVCLYSNDATGSISVSIRKVKFHKEIAGTSTDSMDNLTTVGLVGRAALLDGTDYISAPWGGFSYPLTVACRFKLDVLNEGAQRTLVSFADASANNLYWQLGVNSIGTNLFVSRRNTTAYAEYNAVNLVAGQWHTAAIVYHNETSFSLYFDDELIATETGLDSVDVSSAVDTLLIGLLRLITPGQYASGITFDEVNVWKRELSTEELTVLHNLSNNQNISNTVNYELYTMLPTANAHSQRLLARFKSVKVIKNVNPDITEQINLEFDLGTDISSATTKQFRILQNSVEPISGDLVFNTDGTDGLVTILLDANVISTDFIVQLTIDDWTSNRYLIRI